jgi:hypothetical protein
VEGKGPPYYLDELSKKKPERYSGAEDRGIPLVVVSDSWGRVSGG